MSCAIDSTGPVRRLLPFASIAAILVIAFAAPRAQAPAQEYTETVPGTAVSFDMVLVPGRAGAPPLYFSRTEVTWDLYDLYAIGLDGAGDLPPGVDAIARPSSPYGAPDYGWGHEGFPVISVTEQAAGAFARWLSLKTGREYRLPTEAEWEHAATLAWAGVTVDDVAWHEGNAGGRTHRGASRKPDALGLFDLFGNAAEWVTTTGDDPVARGGSFRDSASVVGPSARAVQDARWNERDPQLPKSEWWLSDAPFVSIRLVAPIAGATSSRSEP